MIERTLYARPIGINDIGKSFWWTNETDHETNARVQASYFERLTLLRSAGARNFLLLQVSFPFFSYDLSHTDVP